MAVKQIKKGVFLLAIGKRGYAFAAYNMAKSIKSFNSNIQICVLYDKCFDYLRDKSVFDVMIEIPEEQKLTNGKLDPGKAKTYIYDHTPFDETLYLDVDGLALKDIQPLMNEEKPGCFYSIKMGEGGINDSISYSLWASNELIWKNFNLNKDSIYRTIQSSVMWFKKGKECKVLFDKVKESFKKGFEGATLWGGTLPDELIFSGVLAQLNIDPEMGRPIFFGNEYDKRTYTKLAEDYYVLSMFGNGKGNTLTKLRYIEWYDRLVKKFGGYKASEVMRDKHLNR